MSELVVNPELWGWFATAVAIAGVIFNNRLDRRCFGLWIVSNFISAALHFDAGIWSLCGRDAVFLVLAVIGFFNWKKKMEIKT